MPRTQPADVRREQLLGAAEQLLLERGLRATTVADVADQAGVAKGTMYLYFRSKDELLDGLRSRYLGRSLRPSRSSRAPARVRIRRLVTALVEVAADNRQLHHVLFHEAGFSEVDALADVRRRLGALLDEGVAAGELAVPDTRVASSFILHGVQGTLVEVLHGPRRRGRRRAARELADLVDAALRPA